MLPQRSWVGWVGVELGLDHTHEVIKRGNLGRNLQRLGGGGGVGGGVRLCNAERSCCNPRRKLNSILNLLPTTVAETCA